jgi:hypothetical protein
MTTDSDAVDPRIEQARRLVTGLAERPAVDHAEVYEEAHRLLADVLERPSAG